MTGTAFAQIPLETESFDAPLSNAQLANLETSRVVFFAADAITDREKRELRFKEFGGIHMPQIKTLQDTKGMIYKCALTRLPSFKMQADWDNMIGPDVKHWDRAFKRTVVKDGVATEVTVDGFMESDPQASKEGTLVHKKSKHLAFKKRYPGEDIKRVTQRSTPHGAGGVVEVEALMGASAAEVREAQYFFFPEWAEIKQGTKTLPNTIREVENHLKARVATIDTQPWDGAKISKYHSIGRDMLRSCAEYRIAGLDVLQRNETILKDAAAKGLNVAYPPSCETLLTQLEHKRKDDLVAGESSAVSELAREMREDRKDNQEMKRKELELKELELKIRAKELGIDMPEVAAPVVAEVLTPEVHVVTDATFETAVGPTDTLTLSEMREAVDTVDLSQVMIEPVPTVDADVRTCGKPTASGAPCTRILKDGETACWGHVEK